MSYKASPCTTVCRICLAIDARTYPLSGTHLQSVFEKLTNTILHTHDQRPIEACYICYQQLLKSYKLIQMSDKAEDVLTDIFKRCNKITKQSISLVNRQAKGLSGYLCFSNVDYYSTLPPPEKKSNEVEIEVKLERIKADDQDNIETEMYEEDIEADVDSVDAVPLFGATEHYTTDTKEENPDGGTIYITETHVQETSEQHLIPKASTSERRHECNICLKRYKNKYHLQRHLMVHSDEKPFKCRLCGSRFRTKYHMANHLLAIHKINKDLFKCDKCGSTFKDRTKFRNHVRTHVYECDFCQQGISNRQEFINHVRTHTGEKRERKNTGERFECNICLVNFAQKSTLLLHLKNKHSDSKLVAENLVDCIICNAIVYKSDLKVHSRIHKNHLKCSVCQQSFKKYYLLAEHVRTHTGERPFECNECHKRYATKPYLKWHLKTHTGEKPHKCNHCMYACQKIGELNRHMRIHTGEKAFECSVCQRRFRFNHILKLHMRTHTGEKPFQCHLCEKRFIDSSSASRHILKMHDVKNDDPQKLLK